MLTAAIVAATLVVGGPSPKALAAASISETLGALMPVVTVLKSAKDAEEPPPIPQPDVADPTGLHVNLLGPDDYLQGSAPPFVAVVSGDVTAIKWKISPPTPGLTVLPGKLTATFTSQTPGVYRIIVAVNGPGGGLDVAEHEFEILERPAQPQPAAKGMKKPAAATLPARPSPDDDESEAPDFVALLTSWVNEVPTNNRAHEARVIGGAFKSTASRIKTKTFPKGVDPLADVQRQLNVGIIANPGAWHSLFQHLRSEAVQVGTTPEELAPWLMGIGDVMAGMR